MNTQFRRALKECERWGVRVKFIERHSKADSAAIRQHMNAPQHYAGINPNGVILWGDSQDVNDASGLLHELMHVVVWRELGDEPYGVIEEEDILALEHEAARRIRTNWFEWMANYEVVSFGTLWAHLNTHARHEVLVEAYATANNNDLMINGKPTYIRRFKINNNERILL
jgi:hypothetical protein